MTDNTQAERLRVGIFLGGTSLSLAGNILAMVALPWFVLETTGSAAQTGLTGMATALPAFLSGIFGGPLVDRLGGRRMSVIADLFSAASILAIPTLYLTIGLDFWQFFALVLLGALLDVPGYTARRTLLPGFGERSNLKPEAINSAFEVLQGVSGILGPALAGILIGPMGAINLLWLTGAGFILSALSVYGVAPDTTRERHEDEPRLSYRQQIAEGLSFIGRDRLLLSLAIIFAVSNFLTNGFYAVGLPVAIFEQFGDASRFGLILSTTSIGMLIGGSLYGAIGDRFRANRRAIVLLGFMVQPFFMVPFVIAAPYAVLLAVSFLSGFMIGPINPLSVTVRFERTPARLHGRVFATYSAISAAMSPLGMALTGYLFEGIGSQAALVTITGIAIGLSLFMPAIRPLRDMNVVAHEREPESVGAPR